MKEERARLRRDRTKALARKQEDRAAEQRTDQAFKDADREIAKINRELGKANTELIKLEEGVLTWDRRLFDRQEEYKKALGLTFETGGKTYEFTWGYRRLMRQTAIAERRKGEWVKRARAHEKLMAQLTARKTLWEQWILDELKEQKRRLFGG
ncbi:unnamed protein product [marine sediment metagenome]|uniref:Uncharacterized protein n=1 Tax=marine sediment metagenome TaxID=412755 RepID=X0WI82_9ZZZZ